MWTASLHRANRIDRRRTMNLPSHDSFDAFVLRLDRDAAPPFATPMLRAIWHGLRGDWPAAHELAQARDDADGARVSRIPAITLRENAAQQAWFPQNRRCFWFGQENHHARQRP